LAGAEQPESVSRMFEAQEQSVEAKGYNKESIENRMAKRGSTKEADGVEELPEFSVPRGMYQENLLLLVNEIEPKKGWNPEKSKTDLSKFGPFLMLELLRREDVQLKRALTMLEKGSAKSKESSLDSRGKELLACVDSNMLVSDFLSLSACQTYKDTDWSNTAKLVTMDTTLFKNAATWSVVSRICAVKLIIIVSPNTLAAQKECNENGSYYTAMVDAVVGFLEEGMKEGEVEKKYPNLMKVKETFMEEDEM
jgi:hypothetical protein